MMSGDMVDDATLATMQSASAQTFATSQQAVSYSWQVGAQTYNQFQGLKDSTGAFVTFDPPLMLAYSATAANFAIGAAQYLNKDYQLQWTGDGNLGIPGAQDANLGFFFPYFNILKGGIAGASNQYILQPLMGNATPTDVDASLCSGLDTTKVPALPKISIYNQTQANNDAIPDQSKLIVLFNSGTYIGP